LPVKIPQTRAGQRRVAAVGVFTNRKMGDVFSFLDSFSVPQNIN
jgi:hypothetical protein